jgi:hypothetical protein
VSFQKSPLQICRVSRRIWCLLSAPVSRSCWNRKCLGTRGDKTLVFCNSQCSHSDATRRTEWRRSLLSTTAHAFPYCHRLAFYVTNLETFWYTNVFRLFSLMFMACENIHLICQTFVICLFRSARGPTQPPENSWRFAFFNLLIFTYLLLT